jgi:hypothetical protein
MRPQHKAAWGAVVTARIPLIRECGSYYDSGDMAGFNDCVERVTGQSRLERLPILARTRTHARPGTTPRGLAGRAPHPRRHSDHDGAWWRGMTVMGLGRAQIERLRLMRD